MSWLSKALGLDKKPETLAKINKVGREAIDLAERALNRSLAQLVEERDLDAFALRVKTELGVILSAQTKALKDEICEALLEELR